MNHSFFITGTDTDVGKTIVAAMWVRTLRKTSCNTVPFKPVQTGAPKIDGHLGVPDIDTVMDLNGLLPQDHERLAPYRYEPACSPHLAAKLAGKTISLQHIVGMARTCHEEYGSIVVEGSGGVLVPLNDSETMLDLMSMLNLPLILVARTGLGTLNHTFLTVNALKHSGLKLTAIVMVNSNDIEPDYISENNLETIAEKTGVPVIGPIPYTENIEDPAVFAALHDQWHERLEALL